MKYKCLKKDDKCPECGEWKKSKNSATCERWVRNPTQCLVKGYALIKRFL